MSGLVCDYFYKNSPGQSINIHGFEKQLNKKEVIAEKVMNDLKSIIIHTSVDSLNRYAFGNDEIFYFVYNKNELVYWSDNQIDISNISMSSSSNWQYVQLPNAFCIAKVLCFKSTRILALITVKHNYPYENEELNNSFSNGLELDKRIQITSGNKTDRYAISDSNNTYLFSLIEPKTPLYNENWAIASVIAYSLFFLVFFYLYANSARLFKKKLIQIHVFISLFVAIGLIMCLLMYFNLPALFFLNKLFTPFQYSSNLLLKSISHLTVFTGFFISSVYLFFFRTKFRPTKQLFYRLIIQIACIIYFLLLYNILSGLIYHSSIRLSILHFKDLSVVALWIHFLILLWGLGLALLFLKSHIPLKNNVLLKKTILIDVILILIVFLISYIISPADAIRILISISVLWFSFYLYYFRSKFKSDSGIIAFWGFIYVVFLLGNSFIINKNKKSDKYKVLAQNIYLNGSSTENDPMAEMMFEDLDRKISNDFKLTKLLIKNDSLVSANEYLSKTYLRGFWNKYEMRLNKAEIHSSLYNDYELSILKSGNKLQNTHFFNLLSTENNLSYIGKFQLNYNRQDSLFFFMEFYPRRNFKSFSFPNLLIASTADIQTQLNISIAKYERSKIVYSLGKIEYPAKSDWIQKQKSEFFDQLFGGRNHYIYAPNSSTYIVISEQESATPITYILYLTYCFLAFYTICRLIYWTFRLSNKNWNFQLGLTAKFQYTFIFLLIISFICIFYVSVNFIQQKYQDEQITNLNNKKLYIQKALQDLYYWNQDLNSQNSQSLNFDLQDLSYIYHTDIHVYNNRGKMIGSSQPLIFKKNLIGTRISPAPYFQTNSNIDRIEHIGKLSYLTGYEDFVNGDFLQIGYIAVPQFLSQDEIKNEIESFLSVIIHIYLIIIILAILLSLFIGKQLSAPLNMLENKLKEMRLGRRNEKINYSLNDEIGQLVLQYNRTVDELEQSARLLAQSERESAWKSMARQVAHEINNPLTPMKLTIQQLQRTKKNNDELFDNYFAKSTSMLIEQIDNLSRIAGTFSDFARMPEAKFERIDIAAKLYSVVQLFANNNEHIQVDFEGLEKDIYIYADPEQMVQVFNNLLKNAIQSIPENREGIVNTSISIDSENVKIEITDNGNGISEDIQDKLFVPSFTTKSTGMGLGLAISKNIIELTGGTITFITQENEGTTFVLILPEAT